LLEMLVAQYQGNTTLVIHTKWQKLNNLYCWPYIMTMFFHTAYTVPHNSHNISWLFP
jgi:hypothetical protein